MRLTLILEVLKTLERRERNVLSDSKFVMDGAKRNAEALANARDIIDASATTSTLLNPAPQIRIKLVAPPASRDWSALLLCSCGLTDCRCRPANTGAEVASTCANGWNLFCTRMVEAQGPFPTASVSHVCGITGPCNGQPNPEKLVRRFAPRCTQMHQCGKSATGCDGVPRVGLSAAQVAALQKDANR